ncbi:MAG TPA: hypothetical protein VF729_06990 [Solirubrobacterales bacterium]
MGDPIREVRLAASDVEILARRVAELVRPPRTARAPRRLMTAAEVAEWWGVERSWVYAHVEELGARRIGSGERPRLRFDPDEVRERIEALGGSQSGYCCGSAAIPVDSHNRSLSRRRRAIVSTKKERPGGAGTPPARRRR